MSGEQEEPKYTVSEIVESAVSEDNDGPDIALALELADRINNNKEEYITKNKI